MIELVLIFSASFVIGLSGAVMPGPLLALTLKESLSRGGVAALWLSGGHSFCELLLVTAIVAEISKLVIKEKCLRQDKSSRYQEGLDDGYFMAVADQRKKLGI